MPFLCLVIKFKGRTRAKPLKCPLDCSGKWKAEDAAFLSLSRREYLCLFCVDACVCMKCMHCMMSQPEKVHELPVDPPNE